jgi:hypothetical protein
MKSSGIGLMIAGLLIMVGALVYQPTVETAGIYGASSQVYNIGALQYQELLFIAGATAFLSGVILFAIGELLDRLERAGTAKAPELPAEEISSATYCDWCERNKFPYKACSNASEEVNRERAPRVQDPVCQAELHARGFLPTGPGIS